MTVIALNKPTLELIEGRRGDEPILRPVLGFDPEEIFLAKRWKASHLHLLDGFDVRPKSRRVAVHESEPYLYGSSGDEHDGHCS